MIRKEKILIVGGAGYIGSHVNLQLLDAGFETVVLDNLSQGRRASVIDTTFVEGDLADLNLLDALFSQHSFSAVMHFAAFIEVDASMRCPSEYYRNNAVNSLHLFDAMRRHAVELLVFSSTAAVYGLPQTQRIAETDPCHPTSPYGRSKWMVEEILQDYSHAYPFRYIALRYFNAAGYDPEGRLKNERGAEPHLIPKALRTLKQGRQFPLTINGTDYETPDGTCVRDYIHVSDLSIAHQIALSQLLNGCSSNRYNLGGGHGFSVRQVIAAIETVTGQALAVKEGPRRPGDPPYLVADISKAARELQWHPRYDLQVMIAHAWKALD